MRAGASGLATPFELAGFRVYPSLLRVKGDGGETRLEAKAMAVLLYLARHAGTVVSRSELEQSLWSGRVVTEDAVTNAILKLRRALGDNARDPHVIETIPKTGYRLIARVNWLEESAEPQPAEGPSPLAARLAGPGRLALLAVMSALVLLVAWRMLVVERAVPATTRPAVAVLPFRNLGASPDQDYFANGITADLMTDLSKVSGVSVIAPGLGSAGGVDDTMPAQISADLGVDYVLLGTAQRAGERLRVNVQLIGADEERALWGERYEGAIDDLFSIQDALTAGVIAALRVEIAPEEHDVLRRRPTVSVAAYDAYLRGIEAHGHRSEEQNQIAKGHFRDAIRLDPAFAMAYTGLALSHSRDAIDGWAATPRAALEQAAELVRIAVAIDPSLPQVHFVRGQVELFQGRHVAAVEATERAVAAYPNYADAFALRAWILNYAGRPDEAAAAMEQAMRFNPRPSASYLEVLGEIRFVQRRYREAAEVFGQVLDINPNYARARMWIASTLALGGDLERAEWEAIELSVLSPGLTLDRLAFAFPFKDPRELDKVLDGLRKAGLGE